MKIAPWLIAGTIIGTAFAGIAEARQILQSLRYVGVGAMFTAAARPAPQVIGLEFRQGPEEETSFLKNVTGSVKPARVPSDHVPTPKGLPLVVTSGATGFLGLNHLDQRRADNGNAFSSEPPDQCLAVGNGFVLEGVNSAFRVRSTAGASLSPVVSMNKFFGLPVAIDRSADPVVYGAFTSDPKCLYDAPTQRWFVTILVIDVDPATGDFLPASSVRIAVSQGKDPGGLYNLYSVDTTNDTGTPEHAGCPCLGDQPLIGADATGFYITTNEFPLFEAGFNGAQIYATSKAKLIAGTPGPVVMFSGLPLAEGMAYSVQPATVPPGGAFATDNGGTEYFLSALEFTNGLDNRIAVWAMTNTSSLDAATPNVALQSAVIDSQVYGFPPAAQQKDGPLPLGEAIAAGLFGVKTGKQHLPLLESNDDRMQQTVFANGRLWSSLTTVVKPANGPVRSGAAWFAVEPSWSGAKLGGKVADQGYVSVNGKSVLFPALGVNNSGFAVMGFTLVGIDLFPSAAYSILGTGGEVRIAAAGAAPDDGLTGYPIILGTNAGRWGDYSAAVADENGDIWFATEFIPNTPRTLLANWGTFIAKVPRP